MGRKAFVTLADVPKVDDRAARPVGRLLRTQANTDAGIYLVGWDPTELWSYGEERRSKAAQCDRGQLERELDEQAESLLAILSFVPSPSCSTSRARIQRASRQRAVGRRLLEAEADVNRPGPAGTEPSGLVVLDGREIAARFAARAAAGYGPRLRRVVLFGSWARGDADPEGPGSSDVDLLVVLKDPISRDEVWRGHAADIADDLALEAFRAVSAFVVGESAIALPVEPWLAQALEEGVEVPV